MRVTTSGPTVRRNPAEQETKSAEPTKAPQQSNWKFTKPAKK